MRLIGQIQALSCVPENHLSPALYRQKHPNLTADWVINADQTIETDREVMVSIPGRERGLDISYPAPNLKRHDPYGGSVSSSTPTSPTWEETLQLLSRELQVICRSPDRYDIPSFPVISPRASPGPASPTSGELLNRSDAKVLTVRHLQSEEKLREKLTHICKSPRRFLRASTGSDIDIGKGSKLSRSTKRKAGSYGLPYFRTSIQIGNRGIEDINVIIEGHELKVFTKSDKPCDGPCDLPAIIDIPPEVNPAKLLCIVKDGGILEVKESKPRRVGLSRGKFINGLDLRRSLSTGGQRWHLNSEQSPIVIEDEGSHQLKLVLQVPKGFNFEDLKIKTVDDHLIVSGRQGSQSLAESCDLAASQTIARFFREKDELFQVFELPSSVDAYSITAHLTDDMQLVIQAKLSPRSRSNTM